MKQENKPYRPFRLGRKQQRVILNDEGLEVCIFHEKNKHLAPKVVDFLNEFVIGRKNESKEELAERAIESSRKLYEMHNGMKYDPNHADGFPHLKDIQYDNTWWPLVELIGGSMYSLRKAHLAQKNIIQDGKKASIIKDIEDQGRLHKIRKKSELSVIKYRRK